MIDTMRQLRRPADEVPHDQGGASPPALHAQHLGRAASGRCQRQEEGCFDRRVRQGVRRERCAGKGDGWRYRQEALKLCRQTCRPGTQLTSDYAAHDRWLVNLQDVITSNRLDDLWENQQVPTLEAVQRQFSKETSEKQQELFTVAMKQWQTENTQNYGGVSRFSF